MTEQQNEAPVEEQRSVAVEVHHQQGGQMSAGASVSAGGAEHGSEELLRFVRDLQLAYQAAQMLVSTSFVPQSYSGKATEAAAAIVTGQGLGLDPLASLRSMDVIQGTPAFRAITIRAIVQAHGHEIWVEESTSHRAIVRGKRRGTDKIETSVWDMDRARGLGLLNKHNWKNQPGAMLVARATAEVGRLIAADALLGMAYSIEELEDGAEPKPTEEAAPKPRATRTAARKPRRERETVPALPEEPTPLPEPEEPAEDAALPDDPMQLTPEERAEYGLEGGEQS